jgi:type II secretory pathway component PulM
MVDLQRAAALPSSTAAAAAGAGSQELMTLVGATARPFGLISSFQSQRYDANDTYRVVFQNAPFEQLMEWLITLDREHGVRANTVLNLARASSSPGLVSGQLVLSQS